jgi:ABC-type glycerol-3-phosphate transport system substrate-binding protein
LALGRIFEQAGLVEGNDDKTWDLGVIAKKLKEACKF